MSLKQQQKVLGRNDQNTQQSSKIWLNEAENCEDSGGSAHVTVVCKGSGGTPLKH